VFCGAIEIGQGSDDVLAAIVAEVLGIDAYDVRVVTGDTGITPVDLGSYSSRVTVMMGNAAIQAAERLRDLIARAAADHMETLPENVGFARGRVFRADDPGKLMSFREAIVLAEEKFGTLGSVGSYSPPRSPGRYKGAGSGPRPRTPIRPAWSRPKWTATPAGSPCQKCGSRTTSAAPSTR